VCEAKTVKSAVDEPPEVELKDLPPHLEYAFLEGDNKLPVIIPKELGDEEKSALIKVNPKIHDLIKKELEKLLDAGLIYPIFDSPWVSPVHCVPKKGGFTVGENEENELILTRLVTGWQVCIDYHKLNEATRKDHFPLPFMDQMLERLGGNEYYYFLDGFSGYFQIPIDPRDQEKATIKVDKAKINVIAKLPHPTTVKDCIQAFQTLKKKLTKASILIAPNWDLPFELMCNASDFAIGVVLGQRHEKHFKPIHYASKTMNDTETNYTTTEKEMLAVVYAFEKFQSKLSTFSRLATMDLRGDIMVQISLPKISLMSVSSGPPFTKMPTSLLKIVTRANGKGKFRNEMRCPRIPSKLVKSLTYGASILWARSRLHEGTRENRASWSDKLDDAL
nr:DNA-directed DNA polymerase [Tanacetum cinerariifolium]